jgi:SAM-dependent methyltransferase
MKKAIRKKSGFKLDIGGGHDKQAGCVCLDDRKLPGVDFLVKDIEDAKFPLPDNSCIQILISHVIHRICPKKVVGLMNEIWRIMQPEGQLMIAMPYAGTPGFWQDPTACHAWNEATAYYFDPQPASLAGQKNGLYNVHKPKPWKIVRNTWYQGGNMEIILEKREEK